MINFSETRNSLEASMTWRLRHQHYPQYFALLTANLRRCAGLFAILFLTALITFSINAPSYAQDRYASIIVDADNLDILHARKIDAKRYPASLTKVMTLYLVFDALDAGQIKLSDKVTISKNAARTPPVKMGLKAGPMFLPCTSYLFWPFKLAQHGQGRVFLEVSTHSCADS